MIGRGNRKAQFLSDTLFGKCARPQMRALYRKLYREYYAGSLEEREFAALIWRLSILRETNPRILRSVRRFPDFVICSDAATTGNRLADLLVKGGQSGHPFILRAEAASAPEFWADAFHRTNRIYGLDLLALLAFIYMIRFVLNGSSINCYLDNNNALASLIKGDIDTTIIAAMVATFLRFLQKFNIDIS